MAAPLKSERLVSRTPCWQSACSRGAFRDGPGRRCPVRPARVMCRRDGTARTQGTSNGTPAASAFRTRAGASVVKSGVTALDDDQERGGRLLLLGKGAVLAHRVARSLVLSWTTLSSHDAAPGEIAARDCASWRRIARAIACASMRQRRAAQSRRSRRCRNRPKRKPGRHHVCGTSRGQSSRAWSPRRPEG